jgi:hypothetical protein
MRRRPESHPIGRGGAAADAPGPGHFSKHKIFPGAVAGRLGGGK